jgi:phosphatidylglycerol:prolipoprotein diacylglycerol transferase
VHPVLFELGALRVTSYGVALLIAFGVGIAVAARRAERDGIAPDRIVDVGIVALVASLLGSRLLWLLTHRDLVDGSVLTALLPFGGERYGLSGLSMQGGVVLAIVAVFACLRWRGVPLLPAADAIAPTVSLGEGITRLGCFLNGCCYGLVCELPWGVRFPSGSQPVERFGDVAVHPTQLYASAAGFAIFALLSLGSARRPFAGATLCAWLVLFGLQRLLVDVFRYYESSVTLFHLGTLPFTVNTVVAVALVAGGLAVYASLSSGTSKRSR